MSDELQVGDLLQTEDQINALPDGAEIEAVHNVDEWYRKEGSGQWRTATGRLYDGGFAGGGYNRVRSLPDGTPTERRVETARQYAWRFRSHVLAAALDHGYDRGMVLTAMREIGYTDDMFPFGVGMRLSTMYDMGRLPEGSVLHIGDPDHYRVYGVFALRNGNFRHVLGNSRTLGHSAFVDLVGGEPVQQEWIEERGGPDSVTEVALFKAKAYEVGWRVKKAHSWCETYDNIVGEVGVDRYARRVARAGDTQVGETVPPAVAARLPVGTVLRWRHHESPETRTVWYMRVDGAANAAGTRRVFGYRDDYPNRLGHYQDAMEVMSFPQPLDIEGGTWPEIDVGITRQVWDLLPPGTHLAYHMGHYVKALNGQVGNWYENDDSIPVNGTYTLRNFTNSELRVVSFPTPQ